MSGANQRATVTRIKSQRLIKAERELAALLAEPVPTDPEMRAYYDEACRFMREAVDDLRHADALRAYTLRKFGPNPQTSSAEEIAP
jgi:hypothetical protein